jgi:hypothetical protein
MVQVQVNDPRYDLCHPGMMTECDLLQISQMMNWGKIYGINNPFLVPDPKLSSRGLGHLRGSTSKFAYWLYK